MSYDSRDDTTPMTSSTRIERVEVVVACARHGKTHEFRTVLDFEEMVNRLIDAAWDQGYSIGDKEATAMLAEALGVTREGTE